MTGNALLQAVIKSAGDAIYQAAAVRLDDMRLVSLRSAAKLLGICPAQARKLLKNAPVVELGENTRRYKISTIRELIESRTI